MLIKYAACPPEIGMDGLFTILSSTPAAPYHDTSILSHTALMVKFKRKVHQLRSLIPTCVTNRSVGKMSIHLFYQHVIQVLCELFIIYFPSIFDDLFWLVNNFSPSSLMRSENLLPKSFKSNATSQSWQETFSCLFLGVSIFTLQKTLASSP